MKEYMMKGKKENDSCNEAPELARIFLILSIKSRMKIGLDYPALICTPHGAKIAGYLTTQSPHLHKILYS
jgi:hypothetical protein